MAHQVNLIDHPLIQHKLSLMRRRETPTATFRQLVSEIALLLGYEVTRDLEMTHQDIETPLEPMSAPHLAGKNLCLVSILLSFVVPRSPIGVIQVYRVVGHNGRKRVVEIQILLPA